MHVKGPAQSYYWHQRQDQCYFPLDHVLCHIESPVLLTPRGQNHISKSGEILNLEKWCDWSHAPI